MDLFQDMQTLLSAQGNVILALVSGEEERYADAVIEFKALLNISKSEPLGYANIGLAYLRMQGELKKSEDYLDTSLDLYLINI